MSDEIIGIPDIHGLSREKLFQLRQVAASYAKMLLVAEESVHRTNPGMAKYLQECYREASRQTVLYEQILEGNRP